MSRKGWWGLAVSVSLAACGAPQLATTPTPAAGADGLVRDGATYPDANPYRVLALDEPSSALDAEAEAELWASLREVADAGHTVLLVSHRRTARGIADTVVDLGVPA